MKHLLHIVGFLIWFQISSSQSGTTLRGTVADSENTLPGTEVLNLSSKIITHTDRKGQFTIKVNPQDILVFISKNHVIKKVYLGDQLYKTDLNVIMTPKKEQLDEVVVSSNAKPDYNSQKITDTPYFDDNQSVPKVRMFNDGSIVNGTDFVRIYKDIVKLFRKNKEQKTIAFKDRMLNDYDSQFFSETLGIQKEEIVPFIEYCEADPKSKTITDNSNTLDVIEFLMAKKAEYKKSNP
ncbi:carboxypeptidase-like regulatory domain-containing protein [Flavobacterium amniphilum]|uniref:carboxypeptidase-like regulatory domain-containing protein n=1 Tax=Flavobacterium amniphilum TaxID=1834035 RepID=UPI002029DBD8|nr:carboxypeptidase-like regulatory domain-containing protein [Flavobacterium amniphilum]MCL9806104.1 carboxypeptidase-like regulatory domain-containing protein [Flavobacterium amniphilum]